jgi:Na+/H+ antiporter NhaD/arsenite permease-like protein
MLLSEILLLCIFIGLLIAIALDLLERAVLALIAAILTYTILIFLENASPIIIPDFLFGTATDGYVNFHSITLIFGMMFIVQIANEAGLFQFLSFKLIQLTKGRPYFLLIVFCLLAVVLTAIINDILTVIILIPLTITVCRILNSNPIPYIITQAIIIKQGATIFMISSIPSILISNHLKLSFIEYFVNVGLISLGIITITLIWFLFYFKNKLPLPRKGIDMLLEFNVGNFITNRPLLYKTIVVFSVLLVSFIIVPQEILPPDAIALICAVVLATISKLDLEKLLHRMDFTIIIYLLGIFVVTGGLEYIGFMNRIGNLFGQMDSLNPVTLFIMVLWLAAGASAMVDNIPIMKLMLPVVDVVTDGLTGSDKILPYSALACGIVWGDNLSPFGDTILTLNVAAQNKVDITPGMFFRIGFITTLMQLITLSLGYSLMMDPIVGFGILGILCAIAIVIFIIWRIKYLKKQGFDPQKPKKEIPAPK